MHMGTAVHCGDQPSNTTSQRCFLNAKSLGIIIGFDIFNPNRFNVLVRGRGSLDVRHLSLRRCRLVVIAPLNYILAFGPHYLHADYPVPFLIFQLRESSTASIKNHGEALTVYRLVDTTLSPGQPRAWGRRPCATRTKSSRTMARRRRSWIVERHVASKAMVTVHQVHRVWSLVRSLLCSPRYLCIQQGFR